MNKIIKNTLILTAITVVSGCLLGLVYEITKAPIAAAQEAAKQEAYRTVLEEAKEFVAEEKFSDTEAAKLLTKAGISGTDIDEVVIAKNDAGEVLGYVITATSHEGYGGDIQISVGMLADGTVKGIEMLSISETAGLGMKAKEPDFKEQFKDKLVSMFSVTKSGSSNDSEIDALSGATITSNAVTNAVNSAIVYYQNMLGGSVSE